MYFWGKYEILENCRKWNIVIYGLLVFVVSYSLTTVEKPKETQTPAEKCSETPAAKTAPLSNPISVSVQVASPCGIKPLSNLLNQKWCKKTIRVYLIFIAEYSVLYICS